jgi:hypothetical protein
MIVGTVGVLAVTPRHHPPSAPVKAPRAYERPWLTPEAAAQIVNSDGRLGPLFADVVLGGAAPSAATRARIAAFARKNQVDIRFEVVDGDLAAIRFVATFGGCCGYEGADTLATRLKRGRVYGPGEDDWNWADDWSAATDDDAYLTAHVRVNRVEVRWEPQATLTELLDRAESVIGQDQASVQKSAGDHWAELARERDEDVLEVPFAFCRDCDYTSPASRGLRLTTERGRITQVTFKLPDPEPSDGGASLDDVLRARWGRPHLVGQDPATLVWQIHGHRISVDSEIYEPTFVMSVSQ